MKKSAQTLVALSLTLFIAAAGIWFMSARLRSQINFGLVMDPTCLRFDEVYAQSDFVWKLRVRNESTEARDIVGLDTSCGCQDVFPSAFTLLPGEEKEIELDLDLRRVGTDQGHVTPEMSVVPRVIANEGGCFRRRLDAHGVGPSPRSIGPAGCHLGR